MDHERQKDLILAYEDLTDVERREADAHLAECMACRALLSRLRNIERNAGPRGLLPDLDDAGRFAMDAAGRRDADRSLAALVERLGVAPARRRTPAWGLPRIPAPMTWSRLLLPAAVTAAIAVAVFAPWRQDRGVPLLDVRVTPTRTDRGAGAPVDVGRKVWHTGEEFVLAFRMERAGYPVVFHVDGRGAIDLLYPADAAQRTKFDAGQSVQVPTPRSGVTWVFEGEPGEETFLVAASAEADFPLVDLAAELARLSEDLVPRAGIVRAAQDLLTARVGPVQVIEVEHRP